MKTSSYFESKVKKSFDKFFDKTVINRIGRSSCFIRRKPQKINAMGFVVSFIESCCNGGYTYSEWVGKLSQWLGYPVSKQALFERINQASTVDFAKRLFMDAMSKKIGFVRESALYKSFPRVLLQDSTTLSLPESLKEEYPGNKSGGRQKAIARLQCLINIKTMRWLDIALHSFANNDQSSSSLVLPLLKKGDLLIRDLGYFVLDVFGKIEHQQAFYISRLRYGINLYDADGKPLNWKQLSKANGVVDKWVYIGLKQKLRVRIIMIPLPKTQVAEKIRKAKMDRDKRLNHSEDYYRWLRYNVFITNVKDTTLTAKQIGEVYKVRWQIEILFKAWKSGLHLQKMLHARCTNLYRVQTSIYLTLMFFCLIIQRLYIPYEKMAYIKRGNHLSLLKVCSFACRNFLSVIMLNTKKITEFLIKYCSYEIRNDRINMTEFVRQLNY